MKMTKGNNKTRKENEITYMCGFGEIKLQEQTLHWCQKLAEFDLKPEKYCEEP